MNKILKKEIFKKKSTKLLLIILAVTVLSLTAVGYHLSFKKVTILDEGKELEVKSRKDTIEEVLEEQGISYIPEDVITPTLESKLEDDITITIERAVKVSILADDKTYDLLTPVETVADALNQAKIELGEKDDVYPSLDKPLKQGLNIQVVRAIPIVIEVDGEKTELLTTASNVKEVMEEAEISLGEKDKINHDLETKIEKDLQIKITRVKEKTITEKEDIDFKTVRKNSSSLYKGTNKVVQKGQKGTLEKEIQVTYEDGKEVNRKTINEKTIKKAVDQIIEVGTKAKPAPKASRGGTPSRGSSSNGKATRTLKVVATAYSSEDPGVGNRTSTGATLKKGVIAVDPSVIPYYTRLYVPGYGFGQALDTGSAIKGNRIDLAFGSRAEALRYGRKTVTIQIHGK